MVNALDLKFAALSDPTRRAILARLARGAATVSELRRPFQISQPALSKHLKVLEKAGLIESGQEAQARPRRLNVAALNETVDWVESVRSLWSDSFERLDDLLASIQQPPTER
jgi:DNA-binding transcriptional ArsR family regulator